MHLRPQTLVVVIFLGLLLSGAVVPVVLALVPDSFRRSETVVAVAIGVTAVVVCAFALFGERRKADSPELRE